MNTHDIIAYINQTKESKDLHIINKAIINRLKIVRDYKSAVNRIMFSAGDEVKLNGLRRIPNGTKATITEILRTRCTIRLPQFNPFQSNVSRTLLKWSGKLVTVPLSCVEKI